SWSRRCTASRRTRATPTRRSDSPRRLRTDVRLPRSLLIVVVVVIVLAVASCGVVLISPPGARGDRRGGLAGFLDAFLRGTPPVELDTTTAPCLVGDQLRI